MAAEKHWKERNGMDKLRMGGLTFGREANRFIV